MRIYDAGDKGTALKGRIIISREFFNPDTRDFIHIEAHEIGNGKSPEINLKDGDFLVAFFWVPNGNDGGHGFDGKLHHVVKSMQEYNPPDGFLEMEIPAEAY